MRFQTLKLSVTKKGSINLFVKNKIQQSHESLKTWMNELIIEYINKYKFSFTSYKYISNFKYIKIVKLF